MSCHKGVGTAEKFTTINQHHLSITVAYALVSCIRPDINLESLTTLERRRRFGAGACTVTCRVRRYLGRVCGYQQGNSKAGKSCKVFDQYREFTMKSHRLRPY